MDLPIFGYFFFKGKKIVEAINKCFFAKFNKGRYNKPPHKKMRVSDFMKIGIYYEIIRYYVLAIFFVNMLYEIFKEFILKLEIKIYDDIYEMIYKKICPIFPLLFA